MLTGRLVHGTDHVLINTVREAASVGADGVCAEMKLGSRGELANVGVIADVTERAHRVGLTVLLTIYSDPDYSRTVGDFAFAHVCRLAEELGADLVKTTVPPNEALVRRTASDTSIPILFAGGAVRPGRKIEQEVAAAIASGVRGAAVGREVFGSPYPLETLRSIIKTVHGEAKQ